MGDAKAQRCKGAKWKESREIATKIAYSPVDHRLLLLSALASLRLGAAANAML